MSTELVAAIIAGSVSLSCSIIAVQLARWQTRRALDGAFATRLQEMRLQHYPDAFKITERLGKRLNDTNESLPKIFDSIGKKTKELEIWYSRLNHV